MVMAQGPPDVFFSGMARCSIFGDDRDTAIARWNLLQAAWGVGRVFYSSTASPLSLDASNPLCRFKAIGYSLLPATNSDVSGLSLHIKAKADVVAAGQAQIESILLQLLGNRPSLKIQVESVRSLGEDATVVMFNVVEVQNLGSIKKFPAKDVYTYLCNPTNIQTLQKVNVYRILPQTPFESTQLCEYLATPPQGIDPRLWSQAQRDNPDPSKLLPVPMIGFKTLQSRVKTQDQETKQHQEMLNSLSVELLDTKNRQQTLSTQLVDLKRKHLQLAHRLLQVIVQQEITRKLGFTIQYDEEKIGVKLESLQQRIAAPTQYKGRICELLSQVKLNSQQSGPNQEKYVLDGYLQSDISALLKQQQNGISSIISIVTQDLADLQEIDY